MDMPAARFLAETAATYPGEVTVLATGPLGNLRVAADLAPSFFPNLKRIACMGGYLRPLRIGWRNVAELNLSSDPAAAHDVLNAPCPVTLMNAHVCLQAPFTLWDLPRIARWPRDLRSAVAYWLLAFGFVHCGIGAFYLWDLLPAVYLSCPELFDSHRVRLQSRLQDLEAVTLVVADTGVEQPAINMPSRIIDRRRFKALLFKAWGRALGLDGG
jgi:inosine-uridine nucleoside N-ribohydrolase